MIIDLKDEYLVLNFKKIGKNFIERFLKKVQIEQIAYRMYLCEKCIEIGKCSDCECNAIDMIIEPFSCNSENKFPNFMNQKNWETYKQQNNIIVQNELYL